MEHTWNFCSMFLLWMLICYHLISAFIDNGQKEFMEPLNFKNEDLQSIVTPVKADIFRDLLNQAGYDSQKTRYLYEGFSEGFSLRYEGNLKNIRRLAPNLKLRVGSPCELWNKVMKEVELGRFAGPFEELPFQFFVQSPIGLVPKDKGLKTRLIFHLSYPKDGDSVNSGILKEYCTVHYPDFKRAVNLCIEAGRFCKLAKSDMSSAFQHVPLRRDQWFLMVMRATHPVTKRTYFFVDKCLPFGSSISCAIFREASDAIAFLVSHVTKRLNINYLDDFLFVAYIKSLCDEQVEVFLGICQKINFPVALEKTFLGLYSAHLFRFAFGLREPSGMYPKREGV